MAFHLGGFGRLWSARKSASNPERRSRGKKAAIETIHRKKQGIDATMSRLLAEVAEAQISWEQIQNDRSSREADRLTSVVARAQITHCALARVVAMVDQLSVFDLNACGADLDAAASLFSRLRMEIRVSAARAAEDSQKASAILYNRYRMSA